jgi:hypothetical protein
VDRPGATLKRCVWDARPGPGPGVAGGRGEWYVHPSGSGGEHPRRPWAGDRSFFFGEIVPFGTMSEESPPPRRRPQKDDHRQPAEWIRLSRLVIEFLGYLAVLGYLGWRRDQEYGWNGRGLLGGLLVGLAAWIYRFVRATRRYFD